MVQFNHLKLPEHWESYWSKYPHGYTIMEALIDWVSMVDKIIDSHNQIDLSVSDFKKLLDTFIKKFDINLKTEVSTILKEWEKSGFLDVVISQALQNEVDLFKKQTTDILQQNQSKLKPKIRKPLAVFTFDDATNYDYTHVYPVFKSRGIKQTMGVITNKVGLDAYVNMAQIKEMSSEGGYEIASHSLNHSKPLTQLSDEVLIKELKESKEFLNLNGFNANNFLTPFGNTDKRVMDFTSKFYRSGRVSGIGTLNKFNDMPINTFRLNSILIGETSGVGNDLDFESGIETDTLAHWKWTADEAQKNNDLVIYIAHADVLSINGRLPDLEAFLDYLLLKDMEIVTLDEALDVFENQVETEQLQIGSDGTILGKYAKSKLNNGSEVTAATSFENIPAETISFNSIFDGNGAGLPHNVGGSIFNIKPDRIGTRTWQLFHSSHEKEVNQLYLRGFDVDKKGGNFTKLNNISIVPNIPFVHTPGTFETQMITHSYIDNVNATGYPEATGGLLIAQFVVDDWGSCSETYKIRNTDRHYVRNWDATKSAWTVFKEVVTDTKLVYDEVNFTTPMTDFPRGTSYCQITGGKALFPENTQGLLEILNYAGKGYQYQIYHLYNSTITYKRVWKADNTYSAFVKTSL